MLVIIAVLAGIIFPIVASSKARGQDATAISNMHQIGIAASLYEEVHGGRPTLYALLENGLNPSLVVSPRDSSKRGVERELYASFWGEAKTKEFMPNVRITFVTPWTYNMLDRHLNSIRQAGAAGWLVDQTPGQCRVPYYTHWDGMYRRLLFDTSVVVRHHRKIETGEGPGEPFISQFADFDDQYLWDYNHGLK